MCNLIVMTFDDRKEATQIQYALHQLQENSALDLDATVVTKDDQGTLHFYPMKEGGALVVPSIKALQEVASDKQFVKDVLDSLPFGNTAMFMVMGENDSSTALLTMLMLFSPNDIPVMLPKVVTQNDNMDAHLRAEVETYQAAVANLEALGADSTDVDVEVVYNAVDDAYDRLVYFISAGQGALDT
jgi:hypothetical protein